MSTIDDPNLSRADFLKLLSFGAGGLALGHHGILNADALVNPLSAGRATKEFSLNVDTMRADLGGGHVVNTVGFDGVLPGPLIRATQGDTLKVYVSNHLSESTSVHWHGIPIINKMDGVPN